MKERSTRARAGAAEPLPEGAEALSQPTPEGDLARIIGGLGPKIRELRQQKGLSLQQLAERSDVSAAAIHKIEQGGMVPTITTLLKIAGALGRPVSFFVEEDGGRDDLAVFTPAAGKRPVYTSHKGITLDSISGPYALFLLAGAQATVVPGATSGRKPMQHPGEELVHVTDGVLEFSVAGQAFQLHSGDTLHFRGDQPHTWRNPGETQAKAVWLALRPQ
ncbi:MAG: helix-turn-helix domain-containing protein [Streptosporangiaceae bacterium]